MNDEIRKKRNPLVIVIAVAVMVMLVIVIVFFFTGSKGRKYEKQLNLGQKYLSELDYDNAIAAYKLAIEIDPKRPEAYLGLAEVYIAMKEYDKADEVYAEGLEIVEDLAHLNSAREELRMLLAENDEENDRKEDQEPTPTSKPTPTPTKAPTPTEIPPKELPDDTEQWMVGLQDIYDYLKGLGYDLWAYDNDFDPDNRLTFEDDDAKYYLDMMDSFNYGFDYDMKGNDPEYYGHLYTYTFFNDECGMIRISYGIYYDSEEAAEAKIPTMGQYFTWQGYVYDFNLVRKSFIESKLGQEPVYGGSVVGDDGATYWASSSAGGWYDYIPLDTWGEIKDYIIACIEQQNSY